MAPNKIAAIVAGLMLFALAPPLYAEEQPAPIARQAVGAQCQTTNFAGDEFSNSPVTGVACHGTSSADIVTMMLDFNTNASLLSTSIDCGLGRPCQRRHPAELFHALRPRNASEPGPKS